MKLNTQGWKKIKSEKDHTVMRNKDGHEMKIAHHALSPKFRGQLASLPMAEGGEMPHYAEGTPQVSSVQDSPDQIAQDAQAQAAQAAPADQASPGLPPSVQGGPGPGEVPQNEPMPEYPVPNLPTMPTGAQQVAELQDADRKNYIQGHINDRDAFANDLVNGHITPKTYGELADKSSLGRIGTMFGLMLGGIGSGITGQPNALIGMMDKEIDRDLTAQQNSKSNAQNLYNLTSQRLGTEANANLTNTQAAAQNFAMSKMYYQQIVLHKMMDMTSKLPPGPQRQAAEQAISMMAGKINDGDFSMLDKMHAYQLVNGGSAANTGDPESQWQARNLGMMRSGDPALIARAQDDRQRHVPNVGDAEMPVGDKDREDLSRMQLFENQIKHVRQWANDHSGVMNQLNVADRNYGTTQLMNLQSRYREIQGMGQLKGYDIPLLDKELGTNPMSLFNKITNDPKLKAASDANSALLNSVKDKYNLPHNRHTQPQSQGSSDMVNVVNSQGHPGQIPRANLPKALKLGYKVQ